MKNWEKKESARKLRQQGLSYKEIQEQTGLAKSTVSLWCRDVELTSKQKTALFAKYDAQLRGAKSNQDKRRKAIEKIKLSAMSEIDNLSPSEFKIAGLMLYWAEGNKTLYPGLSNSDPKLIKFIMAWFRKVCLVPEEKFKVYLHLHSGQDELRSKMFWSEITGVPLSQFGKSYIKKEGSGHKKNILYHGTAKIGIYNKDLLYRILGWIEAIALPD